MMAALRNVLFIMVDQLRWDHVGAYGGSPVPTPHIDALARRGALLRHAFVQGPVCGPSRMSYYTGRYVASHGARWNRVPLSAAQWTLGDYLRPLGLRATLAGKSHVLPDTAALDRAGIEIESERGALLREGASRPSSASTATARRTRAAAMPTSCAQRATQATTPGTTTWWRCRPRTAACARAGPCATRTCRPACAPSIPRRPT